MSEARIGSLEITVTKHQDRLNNLELKSEGMSKSLDSIERTLEQIKYIAIGMVTYFVLQEFGFFAAFKVASKVV